MNLRITRQQRMQVLQQNEQKYWTRQFQVYENIGRAIMFRAIRRMLEKLPYENMTISNYPGIVKINLQTSDIFNALRDIYIRVSASHTVQLHTEINESITSVKRTNIFGTFIAKFVVEYLRQYGGQRIVSMKETLAKKVINVIADLIENEDPESFYMIIDKIKKEVLGDRFYQYEVWRIVRTEITTASNVTALKMAEDEKRLVLDKKWVSIDDHRVRTKGWDHLEKNGQLVPADDVFEFINKKTGEVNTLLHPGDQKHGVAGNIINCRCRVTLVARKDENGQLIRRGTEAERRYVEPKDPYKNRTMADYEDAIQKLNYERAGVYDKDGNQIFEKGGQKNHVNFTGREMGYLPGNTLTHNHPGNHSNGQYGSSFSDADIRLFSYNGLQEIRAITVDGRLFSLKRKLPFESTTDLFYTESNKMKSLQRLMKRTEGKVRNQFQEWIQETAIDDDVVNERIDFAQANHHHFAWKYIFENNASYRKHYKYSGEAKKFGKEFIDPTLGLKSIKAEEIVNDFTVNQLDYEGFEAIYKRIRNGNS
jgi:hypothetical protein